MSWSVKIEQRILTKEPPRNSSLYFIIRRLLISPEIFLQLWEEMKIRRWHFRVIRWVITEGKSKGSNLFSYSRTYVGSNTVTLKATATPCEENSFEVLLLTSHCPTILHKVNGCSSRHEFWCTTSLISPQTLPAGVQSWIFSFLVTLADQLHLLSLVLSLDDGVRSGYFISGRCFIHSDMFALHSIVLTLNIPRGVLWGPQRVIFFDPAVTISTNLLMIFVCVPHQRKINIM